MGLKESNQTKQPSITENRPDMTEKLLTWTYQNNQTFQFSDEAKKKEAEKKKGMVDMFSQDSDMFSEHYHVRRHIMYNQSFPFQREAF